LFATAAAAAAAATKVSVYVLAGAVTGHADICTQMSASVNHQWRVTDGASLQQLQKLKEFSLQTERCCRLLLPLLAAAAMLLQ
jgi:hypothetical protein